jgi:hypothetical protein
MSIASSAAPETTIGFLKELAEAAGGYAPEESYALSALVDASLVPYASLLATLAGMRERVLRAGTPEAADLWEDLVTAGHELRGALLDRVRELPERYQAALITALLGIKDDTVQGMLVAPELVVAVAGDFKRGKSTLLNALIGEQLLPTRVAPATAVPCLLRYAPAVTVQVHFGDGRAPEHIPATDLEQYACIALPGDDAMVAFRPEVTRLEIGVPWTLPRDIVLIDLPGLNEEAGRAEMALNVLARADAVLFVLAATQLLAEDEIDLIQALWAEGHRALIFVVNYLDQIDDDDCRRVVERARVLLAPYGGVLDRTIFLVSARQSLQARVAGEPAPAESGLPALEARLRQQINDARPALQRVSRLRQVLTSLEIAEEQTGRAALEVQREALVRTTELEGIAERLAAVDRRHAESEAEAAHQVWLLRQRLADLENQFNDRWTMLEDELRQRCKQETLTWVWQQAGVWLREVMIAAIREVAPNVTPRPEGYLRISMAPGLRLGRDALLTFYREEARREWERFTGPARRALAQELEAALAEAEQKHSSLKEQRDAARAPLAAHHAAQQAAVAEVVAATQEAVEQAVAASERLRRVLDALEV